ncbi:MAG: ExeA family protein [bacterium]
MNKTAYRTFFELTKEPFTADLKLKDILITPAIKGIEERFHYAIRLGAAALVTGEIGSGKSTALRYAAGNLHPSEYRILSVTAASGSILDLYRQIINSLGIESTSSSRAVMTRWIRHEIAELARGKKMKILLIIDEASLLRLEVFAELHTLMNFEHDSLPFLSIILAGQANLVDNLLYRNSGPLASRVVGRVHLKGVDRQDMEQYLLHHLSLAGVKRNIFDEPAITAIHQGSGGLFRKANHLARGAIIVAAKKQEPIVNAEHVRIANSEIF